MEARVKNPTTNRTIGYIILFAGFSLLFWGTHYPTSEDPFNGKSPVLIVLAVILFIAVTVWMIMKVRYPYCGKLLELKLYNIDRCRYCGKKTNEE